MDTSDPGSPKVVHAFMPRDCDDYSIKETWDTLGARATRSDDTVLEGCFVSDRYIARVVPAGAAGIDQFVISLFAWALLGFANVYAGLAQRALDFTIDNVKQKSSIGLSRSMAYHAEVQHEIAEMAIELEGITPHLDRVAEDWANGADYGAMWGARIVAAKYHAVTSAWKAVDKGMDVNGALASSRPRVTRGCGAMPRSAVSTRQTRP
jgi:alkylation response protein AidB-like acyl-CoA dehydrogenase